MHPLEWRKWHSCSSLCNQFSYYCISREPKIYTENIYHRSCSYYISYYSCSWYSYY